MRRRLHLPFVIAALICTGPLFCTSPLFAQNNKAKVQNVPDIPFDSVPNFFKLPPNVYFGEGIGVATNSKGHIFVYTRLGETRLYEFDQAGVFVRELGQGLYGMSFAHAVRVDPQDNIWAVDEGSNTVMKFNPAGRVVMVLGRRPPAVDDLIAMRGLGTYTGKARPYSFDRPTDVTWDAAGNIFVSDGYNDARVAKYDKNGRFIRTVGVRGDQPGQLNLPHTIAADAQGNIYVGDRTNARISVFDNDLNFKAVYTQTGAPWAVCITPGPHQYLYASNSIPDNGDSRALLVAGEIYKMELDGTVIGKFGRGGKALKEFSTAHEIDCRNPNELFISEITSWRVQKILLHPQAMSSSSK